MENIFENSDFVYLLNQASGDRQILSKALNISPSQQNYITNSNAGEGLIFYGSTIVPLQNGRTSEGHPALPHHDHQTRRNRTELIGGFLNMNNKMITIPYADAIEYGENTSALFKALWELTDLIRLESDLKKHHRAYLHVREDIDEKVKEARQIMTKVSVDMIGFYFKVDVPKCSNSDENTPFADAADDETVSIPKGEYELMIDDLLTMSEIIQCVADMRTQDVKAIREFGKFVPAFAAFEKNRLSLYREAAKEAEEIFDRWADEIDDLDEDYEPDEYYSD